MAQLLPQETPIAHILPPYTAEAAGAVVQQQETHILRPAGGPYGERLVVNTVDELARRTPDRIYASVSRSLRSLDDSFLDITVRQLAEAVNCASWNIHDRFGRSKNFDVIAYLGVSDIRYAFYTYGAIKTGHVLMIPSVRNSLSQHLAVFEEAKCNKVFYTWEMESRIKELKEAIPGLVAVEVPQLGDLISSESKHYDYQRTWLEGRTDPILIAHSSGSTGNPKPTVITNGVYSTYDNHRRIPQVPGRKIQSYSLLEFDDNGRFFCPFPPFHLAGMFAMTIMPIFYSSTVTLGPPEKPPSGELVSQAMSMVKIRGVWSPPSVIEQLAALPGGLDAIGSLDWMFFTGGPLAEAVGDVVSRRTDLCQLYGSTETGPQIALIPRPENWSWFEWHPVLQNVMEPMGDGTYEMVCYKEPQWIHLLHLQQAYPELDVWRTRDLFVQHPSNTKLWRFVGRRDDVIVLSNGEKFNPVSMEGVITGHPLVKGAIIIGTARIQACLVVEPAEGATMSDDAFIDEIWPTVLEANKVGPAHGRIFKHKIAVATSSKPFIRAGKGTIIRAQTGRLYSEEVEQLYREGGLDEGLVLDFGSSERLSVVTNFVRRSIQSVLSPSDMSDSDDIFVLGMDSLQTLELTRTLQNGLKSQLKGQPQLGAPQIYSHPTIESLSRYIVSILDYRKPDVESTGNNDRTTAMSSLVTKYTSELPQRAPKKLCVAITGTTGSLGSYILEALLQDENVHKIYCLNRSSDAQPRQDQSFRGRGKDLDLTTKVQFLTAKFGHQNFGLQSTEYDHLVQDVDAIIHNAWNVNFNQNLASFEDVHIRGVKDLATFSLSSPRQPHIFFVSSISSVGNWGHARGYHEAVPEAPLDTYSYDVALPLGYAESKHVSERILTSAAANEGLQASILRVGQVAGPVSPDSGGVWNLTEWMPALIKSSKTLGLLPESMNTIDWIPVDTLASIVRDLVKTGCNETTSRVYNVINPHVAEWPDMLEAILEHWRSHGLEDVKVVPWEEWLRALNNAAAQSSDLDQLPAAKISDFFAGLAGDAEACKKNRLTYETRKAQTSSITMANLRAIDGDAMRTWMRQWHF